MQLYVKVAELTLSESDSVLFKEALGSMATEWGLHPLVPYFTCFIAGEVIIFDLMSCWWIRRKISTCILAHSNCVLLPSYLGKKTAASYLIFIHITHQVWNMVLLFSLYIYSLHLFVPIIKRQQQKTDQCKGQDVNGLQVAIVLESSSSSWSNSLGLIQNMLFWKTFPLAVTVKDNWMCHSWFIYMFVHFYIFIILLYLILSSTAKS